MVEQNVRSTSGQQNTGLHAEDSQRRYGVNWPFPPVGGPKVWTAKQRKQHKAKQLADTPEALL